MEISIKAIVHCYNRIIKNDLYRWTKNFQVKNLGHFYSYAITRRTFRNLLLAIYYSSNLKKKKNETRNTQTRVKDKMII